MLLALYVFYTQMDISQKQLSFTMFTNCIMHVKNRIKILKKQEEINNIGTHTENKFLSDYNSVFTQFLT